MTEYDKQLLIEGLQMRMAHIETGTPILRACDVKEHTEYQGRKVRVKALTPEQMKLIIRSEELVEIIRRAK